MVATITLDSEGVHIFAELVQEALLRGSKIDPYKSSGGESFQVLDGKPYASQLTPEPTTVARWPIDEFTLENVVSRQGRPTTILMQFLAPDGQSKTIVGRNIDEHG